MLQSQFSPDLLEGQAEQANGRSFPMEDEGAGALQTLEAGSGIDDDAICVEGIQKDEGMG